MMVQHADEGMICPLHKKDMSLVCHKCPLWIHVRGKHPQSEEEIDDWRCALAWMPLLMIENSQQQRQTAAAVESFRNESVMQNITVMRSAALIEQLGLTGEAKLISDDSHQD